MRDIGRPGAMAPGVWPKRMKNHLAMHLLDYILLNGGKKICCYKFFDITLHYG